MFRVLPATGDPQLVPTGVTPVGRVATVVRVTPRRGPGGSSPDPSIRIRILDAFVALVASNGLSNTSMSDVAQRADVSKTTVYTRWPDRRSLIVDGFAHVSVKAPTLGPDDDFAERFELLLALTAEPDVQTLRRQVYAELLAAAGFDPEVRSVATANREEWRLSIEAVLERGKETGQIPADRDIAVTGEVIMGVILARHLLALPLGEPLRDLVWRLATETTPY